MEIHDIHHFPTFHSPFEHTCIYCKVKTLVTYADLRTSDYNSRTGFYKEHYGFECEHCGKSNDITFTGNEFDDNQLNIEY